MNTGLVKWFRADKGFGYIAVEPSVKRQHGIPAESDLFVHATALVMKYPKELFPGQKVSFHVAKGPKGFCAVGVRLLADTSPARLALEAEVAA